MHHTQDLPSACVIDTNVLFDAVAGGYLHELFSLECAFLTTDIAFREVRTIPAVDLHNFGLKIRGLDGKQVLEMFKLRGNYPALSMEDISVMVLARHTGAILLSGDGPLRRAARKEGVILHGSLWVLDILVAVGRLSPYKAIEAIEMMQQKGSRLPGEECDRRIRDWKDMR